MKKIILLILVIFSVTLGQAQSEDREAQRERIKALKVAFFTQELKLTEKKAEKFWPIYNRYEDDRRDLHKREHVELQNVECMTEKEAEGYINEFLAVENEEYKIKKQLYKDLREFMSAPEIIRLHNLEEEFHRKLIKEYRSKRERKDTDSSE